MNMPDFQDSNEFANGWFFRKEGKFYNKIAKSIHNGNILEIGSYEGLSLSYIKNTISTNNNKIYSVEINCNQKLTNNCNNWKIHLLCESSLEASKEFKDHFFDLIFIDANHHYDSVKSDILNWLPKLKPNGIIAGHDYDWSGVKQAVDEIFSPQFKIHQRIWIADFRKIF